MCKFKLPWNNFVTYSFKKIIVTYINGFMKSSNFKYNISNIVKDFQCKIENNYDEKNKRIHECWERKVGEKDDPSILFERLSLCKKKIEIYRREGESNTIIYWICLICAILHMLNLLKVVIFLLKNINYLLKIYIFNIKCTKRQDKIIALNFLICANLYMIKKKKNFYLL